MKLQALSPLLSVLIAAVATATVPIDEHVPAKFVSEIDWQLVAIVASFGLLGALPRFDPLRTKHTWQQLTSGVVGGLVGGLGAAEIEVFSQAPKTVLVAALVSGYMGTLILDAASQRLLRYIPGPPGPMGPMGPPGPEGGPHA